jgi:hypothetical protein
VLCGWCCSNFEQQPAWVVLAHAHVPCNPPHSPPHTACKGVKCMYQTCHQLTLQHRLSRKVCIGTAAMRDAKHQTTKQPLRALQLHAKGLKHVNITMTASHSDACVPRVDRGVLSTPPNPHKRSTQHGSGTQSTAASGPPRAKISDLSGNSGCG